MTARNSDLSFPQAATTLSAQASHDQRILSVDGQPSLNLGSIALCLHTAVAPWASGSYIDDLQDEDAGGVPLTSDDCISAAVVHSDHNGSRTLLDPHSTEGLTLSETLEGGVQIASAAPSLEMDSIHQLDHHTAGSSDSSSHVQAPQPSTYSRPDATVSHANVHQPDGLSSQVDIASQNDDAVYILRASTEFNQPTTAGLSVGNFGRPESQFDSLDITATNMNVPGFPPPGASEVMLAYYQRGAGSDSNPLDDTRLDYDITDFLDRWHMQIEMPEAGLIELNPERIEGWRPPLTESITELPNSSRDIQGLDWTCLGTRRDLARTARTMLYPSHDYFRRSPRKWIEPRNLFDFKQTHSNHRARFTHFQLRHMLAATSRNDIFYAAYNRVMRTSLACPAIADPIMDLSSPSGSLSRATADCHVTTIAATPQSDFAGYDSHSMLIAGGFEGEYAMLNLNSSNDEAPTEGFVTHAVDGITTHIHTLPNRRTGALGAAFCSNDRKLRILDVTTNTWTDSFEYTDQLNCAATSPDGRLRVVVGDTTHSIITDAERGDVLFSMYEHQDHAFACAWADDGWHVATGAQDGKVVVYDARYWRKPLAQLDHELGCVRSLHFTQTGHGSLALAVAESDDIVSIYDSQSWSSKQTIDFFGSVAGVTTLDGGRELVIANGDKLVGGLMVFERNEDGALYRDAEPFGEGRLRRESRKRAPEYDETDEFWENQPKRFGIGLESLVL